MFNRKLKNRIEDLEMLLEAEKFSHELNKDGKTALMSALTTTLMKDVITMDQYNTIFRLYDQYFSILRGYEKGA